MRTKNERKKLSTTFSNPQIPDIPDFDEDILIDQQPEICQPPNCDIPSHRSVIISPADSLAGPSARSDPVAENTGPRRDVVNNVINIVVQEQNNLNVQRVRAEEAPGNFVFIIYIWFHKFNFNLYKM